MCRPSLPYNLTGKLKYSEYTEAELWNIAQMFILRIKNLMTETKKETKYEQTITWNNASCGTVLW